MKTRTYSKNMTPSSLHLPRRDTPALVSPAWVQERRWDASMAIVDLRDAETYDAGHIPGAVNIPFPSFFVNRGALIMEVPDRDALCGIIGVAGIGRGSRVVLYHATDDPFRIADTARAAFTLIYGGVRNASILDGGIQGWMEAGLELSAEGAAPIPALYEFDPHRDMVVTKDYVLGRIGAARIVDARDASYYFGESVDALAPRPGHIPTAVSMPSPWLWTPEGRYKETAILREMAEKNLGADRSAEIITYCGVGGYGSVAWFVLHELLGYEDVKLYDGSAQEWMSSPETPVNAYTWE